MDFLTLAAEKCEAFLLLASLSRPNVKGFQLYGDERPSRTDVAFEFRLSPAATVALCCLLSAEGNTVGAGFFFFRGVSIKELCIVHKYKNPSEKQEVLHTIIAFTPYMLWL